MGASNESSSGNKSFYKLRAKTSEKDPTPFIGKLKKEGEKWVVGETFKSFSGQLVSARWSTYQSEDGEKHKVTLEFSEVGEISFIDSNFNNLTYAIINSLLSCESYDNVKFDVYLNKAKEGTDKRYAGASVYCGSDPNYVKWYYQFADQPKAVEVMVGTKKVKDDSPVIKFWCDAIDKLNAKLGGAGQTTTVGKITPNEKATQTNQEEIQDLPF